MKNLTLKWVRQYRKKETGKMVFVYAIEGTPEEIAAYKVSKGTFFREDKDTKQALLFSNRFVGQTCKTIVDGKDQLIADTTEYDQLGNLADQYGADLALKMHTGQIPVNG